MHAKLIWSQLIWHSLHCPTHMRCLMLSLPDNRSGILFTREYANLLSLPSNTNQLVGFCLEVSSCICRTHMYISWVSACPKTARIVWGVLVCATAGQRYVANVVTWCDCANDLQYRDYPHRTTARALAIIATADRFLGDTAAGCLRTEFFSRGLVPTRRVCT